MTNNDCPRFQTCNASLCPLGPDASRTGYHACGEEICRYLLAAKKHGSAEYFADRPDRDVFLQCVECLPEIAQQYPSIAKAVDKASKSRFRGAHLRRPQATGCRNMRPLTHQLCLDFSRGEHPEFEATAPGDRAALGRQARKAV